jgi:hypothetical protein
LKRTPMKKLVAQSATDRKEAVTPIGLLRSVRGAQDQHSGRMDAYIIDSGVLVQYVSDWEVNSYTVSNMR